MSILQKPHITFHQTQQAMPPPDNRVVQRTEGPTGERWEQLQPVIRDLYIKQNKPLKDIICIMRANHGLVASVKMYKYRLKGWGIRKNSRSTGTKLEQQRRVGSLGAPSPQSTETTARTPLSAGSRVLETAPVPSMQLQSTRHTEHVLYMLNRFYGNLHDPAAAVTPFWTMEQRRHNWNHRNRAMLALTYLMVPGSTGTMNLTRLMFDEIPKLAKQRERWAIPHGLHSMDRLARIPGASQVARMALDCTRDAARSIGPGHPFAIIWALLRSHQDQRSEEMSAMAAMRPATYHSDSWDPSTSGPDTGVEMAPGFDPWTLEVFARCVDNHMRDHHGTLDPLYLEAHLRMRKNDCTPEEYAAEVQSLLAQGAPREDVLSILECVFGEEMFKESMFIELRSFFSKPEEPRRGRPQHQRPYTTLDPHSQSRTSVPAYFPPTPPSSSPPGNSNPHYTAGGIPVRERMDTTVPSPLPSPYSTTPPVTYPRIVEIAGDDDGDKNDYDAVPTPPMQPQLDIVDTLLGLIGRLQIAARAGGLTLDELNDLKADGAWILNRPLPPSPVPITTALPKMPLLSPVPPAYLAMTPPCS